MLNRLKRAMTPATADEDGNQKMQAIFQADLVESKRGDVRAKFDSGFIPNVHRAEQELPPGVHGWYDADGVLHLFDGSENEISPESLDEEVV
jgi:hypothetical protein